MTLSDADLDYFDALDAFELKAEHDDDDPSAHIRPCPGWHTRDNRRHYAHVRELHEERNVGGAS